MRSSGLLDLIKRYPRAVAASVALHVVLITLLSISLSNNEPAKQPATGKTLQAVMVDARQVEDQAEKIRQAELEKKKQLARETDRARQQLEQEKKRLAELKKREQEKARQAEIKRKQEAEKKRLAVIKKQEQEKRKKLEAERKRKEEQKRKEEAERLAKAEAERKRLEAERLEKERQEAERLERERQKRLAEEAEKRRIAEEAELRRRLEEEERRDAEHNRMLDTLRAQYVRQIERKVTSKWLRPSTSTASQSCEVYVRQTALGDVTSVRLQGCSADVAFQRSVERAVRAASPLPPPPNPEVFDNEIQFTFRPGA